LFLGSSAASGFVDARDIVSVEFSPRGVQVPFVKIFSNTIAKSTLIRNITKQSSSDFKNWKRNAENKMRSAENKI
jgi:hypothetical protein